MGETADQTRAEIVQLRSEMSDRVVDLRRAAERPLKIAQAAAVGAVVIVVVGGIAFTVARARRRAEERTLRGRVRAAGKGVAGAARNPGKAAADVKGAAESKVNATRDDLRGWLLEEVKKQIEKDEARQPAYQKALSAGVKAAAGIAVPLILKRLEEQSRQPAARDTA